MARNSEARKRYEELQREKDRTEHFDDPYIIFGHRGETLIRCRVVGCQQWEKIGSDHHDRIHLCPEHEKAKVLVDVAAKYNEKRGL